MIAEAQRKVIEAHERAEQLLKDEASQKMTDAERQKMMIYRQHAEEITLAMEQQTQKYNAIVKAEQEQTASLREELRSLYEKGHKMETDLTTTIAQLQDQQGQVDMQKERELEARITPRNTHGGVEQVEIGVGPGRVGPPQSQDGASQ